jgi:hypothetical protein
MLALDPIGFRPGPAAIGDRRLTSDGGSHSAKRFDQGDVEHRAARLVALTAPDDGG